MNIDDRKSASDTVAFDAFRHLGITHIIYPVENSGNTTLDKLDHFAGIDYFAMNNEGQLYGIASRNRFVSEENPAIYEDFTVRYQSASGQATECDKRASAIKDGYLYPMLTTQCWYSGSFFLCGASIKTKDLYSYLELYDYRCPVKTAPTGEKFYCVNWDDLRRTGYKINMVTSSFYNKLPMLPALV